MNREEALAYTMNYVWWPKPDALTESLPYTPTGWKWIDDKVGATGKALWNPGYGMITVNDWTTIRDEYDLNVTKAITAEPTRLTAPDFLERGAQHMRDRAAQRDKPDGERSMARAVAAFNAQEGTSLTEEQGWRFMVQLKYSRACAGVFVADDYEDMAAYAGLAGETAQ